MAVLPRIKYMAKPFPGPLLHLLNDVIDACLCPDFSDGDSDCMGSLSICPDTWGVAHDKHRAGGNPYPVGIYLLQEFGHFLFYAWTRAGLPPN